MEVIQIENRRPSSRERNAHSFGRSEHIYDGFYRREAEVVYQLKLLIAAVVSRIVFRDRPVRGLTILVGFLFLKRPTNLRV